MKILFYLFLIIFISLSNENFSSLRSPCNFVCMGKGDLCIRLRSECEKRRRERKLDPPIRKKTNKPPKNINQKNK